ncbi:uncharacterized protein LOC126687813 [Mercurialis annua]|uniref:uncharacterized protein LOC126687813 n=1 Tax=Mercurialis annua TaxID=3986 RepID=UPI00215EB1BE|nr:uncharacterized protein LOC126687813 [Mercurialis annua]
MCPLYFLYYLPIKKLIFHQSSSLSVAFSKEDVFYSLSSCDNNKTSNPDGFNFFLNKKAWNILEEDIINIFYSFHKSADFPIGLNTDFLVLLPKIRGASKVLTIILAPIISSIISYYQLDFVRDTNIHDYHIIASELIHIMHSRRDQVLRSSLILKKPLIRFLESLFQRWVRLGDSLSRILFVIAVEGLRAIVAKVISKILIDGISMDGYDIPVTVCNL